MDWFVGEPTLEDTLSDPIVRARMKCDNVDLVPFRRFLEDIGSRLDPHDNHEVWREAAQRQL
jgi:hypothetical protein